MKTHYDVIVTGGGHNGLTCAAYLARAGLDVLVLEQRHIVGGPCAEYEYFPGYRASITNSPGSLEPKVVQDLELERFGLEFTRPDPSLMFPFPDGRSVMAWRDPQRVADELAKFSKRDVAGYAALFDYLNAFAARLKVSLFEPPPTLRELASRLETPEDEEAFAKLFFGNVVDLLDEFLESPELKSMVTMLGVMTNWLAPSAAGSAFFLLMRPMSLVSSSIESKNDPRRQYLRGSTGLPLGGMGSIVRAMRESIEAAGGTVCTEARVANILTTERGVTGVALEDGREFTAATVVSNLNPRTTFLDLVEPERLETDFRSAVERLPTHGNAFKIALALDGLPTFSAAPKGLEELASGCQFRIAPSIEYQERAFDDAKYGRWSHDPVFWGLISSMADPSLAPPGKHVMSLNIFHAPRDLRDGDWSTEREKFGERCIDVLAQYMPNLKDMILHKRFWSPADLEAEFGLIGGNITHLDMVPRRMFGLRPLAGCSQYSTPVPGLYLCGSGSWPGGTVTGIPGHNASQQVLKGLRQTAPTLVKSTK